MAKEPSVAAACVCATLECAALERAVADPDPFNHDADADADSGVVSSTQMGRSSHGVFAQVIYLSYEDDARVQFGHNDQPSKALIGGAARFSDWFLHQRFCFPAEKRRLRISLAPSSGAGGCHNFSEWVGDRRKDSAR